jgi:hypothetical protein
MTFKNISTGTYYIDTLGFTYIVWRVKYLPIATILVKAIIADDLCGPKTQAALKEARKSEALLTEVASDALSDCETKKTP